MAETCRKCKWVRVDLGNPTMGICMYGRGESSEEETTAGVRQFIVPGTRVPLKTEACEHFEPKAAGVKGHEETWKEGY